MYISECYVFSLKIPLDQYMAFQVKVKPFESLKETQRSEMKNLVIIYHLHLK